MPINRGDRDDIVSDERGRVPCGKVIWQQTILTPIENDGVATHVAGIVIIFRSAHPCPTK
jgi:hypothetical protein